MFVVSRGYGGLGGGRDVGGLWYAFGTKPGGWSYVGRCWSTSLGRGDTPMTPNHVAIHVCSSGYGWNCLDYLMRP